MRKPYFVRYDMYNFNIFPVLVKKILSILLIFSDIFRAFVKIFTICSVLSTFLSTSFTKSTKHMIFFYLTRHRTSPPAPTEKADSSSLSARITISYFFSTRCLGVPFTIIGVSSPRIRGRAYFTYSSLTFVPSSTIHSAGTGRSTFAIA